MGCLNRRLAATGDLSQDNSENLLETALSKLRVNAQGLTGLGCGCRDAVWW